MSYCIVTGCSNRKGNKNYVQLEKENRNNATIAFHIFPKDIERKRQWLKALNLENYNPPKGGAVCSEHFREESYIPQLRVRRLTKDAVPCVIEEKVVHNVNNSNLGSMILGKNTKGIASIQENTNSNEIVHPSTSICHVNNSNMHHVEVIVPDVYAEKAIPIQEDINSDKMVHRSTSVSPSRIFNSPTKERIRKVYKSEIKKLKSQLYVSSYKNKRAQDTIRSLRNVLKNLKKRNLLTLQENNVLQNLSEGTRELVKNEIKKKKKLPVSRQYKPALRQFALSLHFYSPKAYNYVRHKFYNSLPHEKTISRWCTS